jgi:hypothetical protein
MFGRPTGKAAVHALRLSGLRDLDSAAASTAEACLAYAVGRMGVGGCRRLWLGDDLLEPVETVRPAIPVKVAARRRLEEALLENDLRRLAKIP